MVDLAVNWSRAIRRRGVEIHDQQRDWVVFAGDGDGYAIHTSLLYWHYHDATILFFQQQSCVSANNAYRQSIRLQALHWHHHLLSLFLPSRINGVSISLPVIGFITCLTKSFIRDLIRSITWWPLEHLRIHTTPAPFRLAFHHRLFGLTGIGNRYAIHTRRITVSLQARVGSKLDPIEPLLASARRIRGSMKPLWQAMMSSLTISSDWRKTWFRSLCFIQPWSAKTPVYS
jgi:hypothetical protein